ncbi:hypothetical protein BGZ75_006911 [Mortierella antarctica]|nr:hypothetical protein BGZ75_006911 [Mortierella antarctica]
MKRTGQPPRTLPASTGRVSFECGTVDERRPVSVPSPASPVSISAAKAPQDNLLASSAPSAYLTCYTPFSAFSDDDVVPKTMCYTNSPRKQASDGREREPLYTQEHQQRGGDRWASFRDNDVIPDVAQEKVSEAPLQTDQDTRALLASRRAPPSSAPAASPAATTTIAADDTASCNNHIRAAPGIPTRAQSTKIKRSSEPGSGTPPSMREQRRHSSEDGLISTRILAMCLSRSHQEPPIDDEFAIPSKCRMVFHMRDEVSKVKGGQTSTAAGREEDKTGLGAKRNFRPQQQPRQQRYNPHDNMQQPMREFGLKKSASTKCAKTVSFKEPEPWKTFTQAAAATAAATAESTATTTAPLISLGQDEKTTETEPAVILSEPISLCSSYAAEQPSSATPPTKHLSVESTAAADTTRPSSAPASYEKTAARARPGHQRNLSESSLPSSSSGSLTSNANVGGRVISTATTPPSSKSRFGRLWKSLAQRYTHHHQHQQQQQHPHGVARLHVSDGPGGLIRRGSDLEPLVAMARD